MNELEWAELIRVTEDRSERIKYIKHLKRIAYDEGFRDGLRKGFEDAIKFLEERIEFFKELRDDVFRASGNTKYIRGTIASYTRTINVLQDAVNYLRCILGEEGKRKQNYFSRSQTRTAQERARRGEVKAGEE
ncbi:MAG: hypothetical protein DRP11_00525 [Candidatus Aenigmatarchaeota archaeon]|nr:MAG: hypothetical protein DRP11_00525 [Candidatus Aenigmarchaeota archaeon]